MRQGMWCRPFVPFLMLSMSWDAHQTARLLRTIDSYSAPGTVRTGADNLCWWHICGKGENDNISRIASPFWILEILLISVRRPLDRTRSHCTFPFWYDVSSHFVAQQVRTYTNHLYGYPLIHSYRYLNNLELSHACLVPEVLVVRSCDPMHINPY